MITANQKPYYHYLHKIWGTPQVNPSENYICSTALLYLIFMILQLMILPTKHQTIYNVGTIHNSGSSSEHTNFIIPLCNVLELQFPHTLTLGLNTVFG